MTQQIERYYRPKALRYERVACRLRRPGEVLGGCAKVLGGGAASFRIVGYAAWVPAVTTISASLTAHIAASRYDHQIVEFLRRPSSSSGRGIRGPPRQWPMRRRSVRGRHLGREPGLDDAVDKSLTT